MKISVVTISYNQGQFLERAIRSVVAQDYPDLEYIVVDPGSSDGSRAIIEKYRHQIAQIIFEPDEGPVDGLMKGFSHATGDILGYLNADDALLPGTFAKIARAFQANPAVDVFCGHGYKVDANGKILQRIYSDRFSPWLFAHSACVIVQPSTFFRHRAYDRVGGFNPQNIIFWDSELILDFALAGLKIDILPDFFSVFTLHTQSITGQGGQSNPRARQIDAERQRLRAAVYQKVLGQPYTAARPLEWRLARILKWARNPKQFLYRLTETLFPALLHRKHQKWIDAL